MKVSAMRSLLGLGLAATLLAAWLAPEPSDDNVQLVARAQASTDRPSTDSSRSERRGESAEGSVEVLRIRPREVPDTAEPGTGLFASILWGVTAEKVALRPVEAAPAEVLAAPQAPAVPFRVIGRYVEDGQVAVFLQHNDQNLVVRVGDTVAEHYTVESIQEGTLTLVYVPMNLKQTLDVSDSESREAK